MLFLILKLLKKNFELKYVLCVNGRILDIFFNV